MVALALFSSLVLGASEPRPNPFLAEAKALHEQLEFEECLERANAARQWKSTAEERAQVHLFAGLCHFGLGNKRDAEDRFRQALLLDEKIELPPFTSPKTTELFRGVRRRLVKEAPQPPETPPAPAAPTAVASTSDAPLTTNAAEPLPPTPQPAPPTTKALALTPTTSPPVDVPVLAKPRKAPFYRGHELSLGLGAGSVVATGVGVFLGGRAAALEQGANRAAFQSDGLRLAAEARGHATAANAVYVVAAAAALAAGASYYWLEE